MTAKKHWLLHAKTEGGKIVIDEGAVKAVCQKGASLLPSGIISVEGDFKKGVPVEINFKEGKTMKMVAKGIPRYNSNDLKKIIGKKSSEISSILGYESKQEVIHRDELVLTSDF